MEHWLIIFFSGLFARIVYEVANRGFDQGWGLIHFFAIWAITLVVVYGGFVFIDDSGDFW